MTQNIQIEKLRHHPSNPRKEIGDLSELADSIKAQGLICPLLVVPHEDEYFVIAGNRRLEACKLAGLEEVSCEVANISDEDAIGVMMTENMLRQNLSSIEENEGFQLMLDMGKDVEQIAKGTGLKEDTVKMRAKLSKLNKDNLKKACEAGATIFELAAVADIEDEKEREKILKKAGTKDFNNAMYKLKQEAEEKEKMIAVEQFLRDHEFEQFDKSVYDDGYLALQVLDEDGTVVAKHGYMKSHKEYRSWDKEMPKEEDYEEGKYYAFVKGAYGYSVYREVTPEEYEKDKADKEERAAKTEANEAIRNVVEVMNDRHYRMRRDFILGFNDFKKHQKDLKNFAATAFTIVISNGVNSYGLKKDAEELYKAAGEDLSTDKLLLLDSYLLLEGGSFLTTEWKNGQYVYAYNDNDKLSNLYCCLEDLGYQISEEEKQIMCGTHELYPKAEEPTEEEVA